MVQYLLEIIDRSIQYMKIPGKSKHMTLMVWWWCNEFLIFLNYKWNNDSLNLFINKTELEGLNQSSVFENNI